MLKKIHPSNTITCLENFCKKYRKNITFYKPPHETHELLRNLHFKLDKSCYTTETHSSIKYIVISQGRVLVYTFSHELIHHYSTFTVTKDIEAFLYDLLILKKSFTTLVSKYVQYQTIPIKTILKYFFRKTKQKYIHNSTEELPSKFSKYYRKYHSITDVSLKFRISVNLFTDITHLIMEFSKNVTKVGIITQNGNFCVFKFFDVSTMCSLVESVLKSKLPFWKVVTLYENCIIDKDDSNKETFLQKKWYRIPLKKIQLLHGVNISTTTNTVNIYDQYKESNEVFYTLDKSFLLLYSALYLINYLEALSSLTPYGETIDWNFFEFFFNINLEEVDYNLIINAINEVNEDLNKYNSALSRRSDYYADLYKKDLKKSETNLKRILHINKNSIDSNKTTLHENMISLLEDKDIESDTKRLISSKNYSQALSNLTTLFEEYLEQFNSFKYINMHCKTQILPIFQMTNQNILNFLLYPY